MGRYTRARLIISKPTENNAYARVIRLYLFEFQGEIRKKKGKKRKKNNRINSVGIISAVNILKKNTQPSAMDSTSGVVTYII